MRLRLALFDFDGTLADRRDWDLGIFDHGAKSGSGKIVVRVDQAEPAVAGPGRCADAIAEERARVSRVV